MAILDQDLLISLGEERINEIKHPITGMSEKSPADILEFTTRHYGIVTMAKLVQLKGTLTSLGGNSLMGYFVRAQRAYDVLKANNAEQSELDMQDFAA